MTPVDVALTKHFHGCSKLLQLHGGLSWTELQLRRCRSRSRRRSCGRLVRVMSAPAVRFTGADDGLAAEDLNNNTLEDIRNDIRFLKDKIENLHIETSKQLQDLKPKTDTMLNDDSGNQLLNNTYEIPQNDAKEKFIDKGTESETDTFDDLQIQTEEVNELHNDDTSEVDKDIDDYCDDLVTVNSSPTARDSGFSEKHFPPSPDNSLLSSVHSQKISSSSLYRNRHHACFPEHYYER